VRIMDVAISYQLSENSFVCVCVYVGEGEVVNKSLEVFLIVLTHIEQNHQ
jgi:hypothetical protein